MKEKRKGRIWRSIGGLVLTAIGFAIIFALMDKYGRKLYKIHRKRDSIDFDKLGPEIVKNRRRED